LADSVANAGSSHSGRTDAGHDLALRQMPAANHPLTAFVGHQLRIFLEKICNLRFDGLGQ
jgi:hypothetical protein